MSEPTEKQLSFLNRLKYSGPQPRTKEQASELIDEILASKRDRKEAAKFNTPEEQQAYLDRKAKQKTKQKQTEQKTWLRERRKEILQQVREDIRDHHELERDIAKYGEFGPKDKLAGWILRIGPNCEGGHLNGLLVTVEDAITDSDLLPPYDSCLKETCECEIESVLVRDVPKGTRIAERVPDSKHH